MINVILKLMLTLALLLMVIVSISNITGGISCGDRRKEASIMLHKLNQAVTEYWQDTGELPNQVNDLYHDTNHPMWMGPYVKEKDLKDPWGEAFRFHTSSNLMSYQLFTLGADQQFGGEDHAADQFINHHLKPQP